MRPIAFLDTETTAADDTARLVQIAVKHPSFTGADTYKPPVPITFEAMAIHGITEKAVAGRKPFAEEADFWRRHLAGRVVVAHNAPFDVGILRREGIEVKEWIDTLKVARRLWPDWPQHKLQYIRYRLGIEVDAGNAHDALADVIVLEKVFEAMHELERSTINPELLTDEIVVETFKRWSREPSLLHTCNFKKHKGETWASVAAGDPGYIQWLIGQPDLDADLKHTLDHWRQRPKPPAPNPQKKLL